MRLKGRSKIFGRRFVCTHTHRGGNVGIYIDGGGGVGYVVMVMVALVMWW